MRATVLCPGPSLVSPDGGAGVVIAVNGAATHGCDWLAAYDESMIQMWQRSARVGVLTLPDNAAKYRLISTERLAAAGWGVEIDAARSYSKLGAFVLAAYLGASDVRVIGDDMWGAAYHDGARSPFLNDVRWAREREHTARVEALLAARGVTITRATVR